VQDAPVPHEDAPFRGGDDVAERGDTILPRHWRSLGSASLLDQRLHRDTGGQDRPSPGPPQFPRQGADPFQGGVRARGQFCGLPPYHEQRPYRSHPRPAGLEFEAGRPYRRPGVDGIIDDGDLLAADARTERVRQSVVYRVQAAAIGRDDPLRVVELHVQLGGDHLCQEGTADQRAADGLDGEVAQPQRQRPCEAPQACRSQEQRVEVEPQSPVVAGLQTEVPLASGEQGEEFLLQGFAVHRIPVRVEGSAPDPLDLVAQLLQLGDDALPLVPLNLDPPVLDRPTRAIVLLEQGGEFLHAVVIERQVEHGRHALATPTRRLPADMRNRPLTTRKSSSSWSWWCQTNGPRNLTSFTC